MTATILPSSLQVDDVIECNLGLSDPHHLFVVYEMIHGRFPAVSCMTSSLPLYATLMDDEAGRLAIRIVRKASDLKATPANVLPSTLRVGDMIEVTIMGRRVPAICRPDGCFCMDGQLRQFDDCDVARLAIRVLQRAEVGE